MGLKSVLKQMTECHSIGRSHTIQHTCSQEEALAPAVLINKVGRPIRNRERSPGRAAVTQRQSAHLKVMSGASADS